MTESEWKTCRDPLAMWRVFANDADRFDLSLVGCACCRRVWELLTDERLRQGIETRERYARGQASEEELEKAEFGARIARREARAAVDHSETEESPKSAQAWAAGAASNAAYGNYFAASDLAARAKACADAGDWQKSYEVERAAQCDLLRSMIQYPHKAP